MIKNSDDDWVNQISSDEVNENNHMQFDSKGGFDDFTDIFETTHVSSLSTSKEVLHFPRASTASPLFNFAFGSGHEEYGDAESHRSRTIHPMLFTSNSEISLQLNDERKYEDDANERSDEDEVKSAENHYSPNHNDRVSLHTVQLSSIESTVSNINNSNHQKGSIKTYVGSPLPTSHILITNAEIIEPVVAGQYLRRESINNHRSRGGSVTSMTRSSSSNNSPQIETFPLPLANSNNRNSSNNNNNTFPIVPPHRSSSPWIDLLNRTLYGEDVQIMVEEAFANSNNNNNSKTATATNSSDTMAPTISSSGTAPIAAAGSNVISSSSSISSSAIPHVGQRLPLSTNRVIAVENDNTESPGYTSEMNTTTESEQQYEYNSDDVNNHQNLQLQSTQQQHPSSLLFRETSARLLSTISSINTQVSAKMDQLYQPSFTAQDIRYHLGNQNSNNSNSNGDGGNQIKKRVLLPFEINEIITTVDVSQSIFTESEVTASITATAADVSSSSSSSSSSPSTTSTPTKQQPQKQQIKTYEVIIHLKQPKLSSEYLKHHTSPQGERSDTIQIIQFGGSGSSGSESNHNNNSNNNNTTHAVAVADSYEKAVRIGEMLSPPIWAGKSDVGFVSNHSYFSLSSSSSSSAVSPRQQSCSSSSSSVPTTENTPAASASATTKSDLHEMCIICHHTFGLLRPGHHCRNCGYWVCTHCSAKSWPSSMVPTTYHNNEKFVRVCDVCNYMSECFADTLREGKVEEAKAVYRAGNINVNTVLSIYLPLEYPIHCAAQGGSVALMSWLLDELYVPYTYINNQALLNGNQESILAVAIKYHRIEMMMYLTQVKKCPVTDVRDIQLLWRGFHTALKLDTPLPPLDITQSNSSSSNSSRSSSQKLLQQKPKNILQYFTNTSSSGVIAYSSNSPLYTFIDIDNDHINSNGNINISGGITTMRLNINHGCGSDRHNRTSTNSSYNDDIASDPVEFESISGAIEDTPIINNAETLLLTASPSSHQLSSSSSSSSSAPSTSSQQQPRVARASRFRSDRDDNYETATACYPTTSSLRFCQLAQNRPPAIRQLQERELSAVAVATSIHAIELQLMRQQQVSSQPLQLQQSFQPSSQLQSQTQQRAQQTFPQNR